MSPCNKVCYGLNSIGMGSPCIYHLLPTGPPEPPVHCGTNNVTYSTVKVACEGKYDRPYPDFLLEVTVAATGRSVLTLQNSSMEFEVTGLLPGSTYTIAVRAKNKFGTSEPYYFPLLTRLEPIKQIAETKLKEQEHTDNMLAPIVIGAIATVVLLIAVLVLVGFTLRRRALEHQKPPSPVERLLDGSRGKGELPGRTTTQYDGEESTRGSVRSTYRDYREVATISSDVFEKSYPDVQIETSATLLRANRKESQRNEEMGVGRRPSLKAYQSSGGRSPFQWSSDQLTPEESIACLPLQQEHLEPVIGAGSEVFSSHNQAFLANSSNCFSGHSGPNYPTDPLILSKESRI